MSQFEREDEQVMDMVNDHATPEAAQAAEKIAREVEEMGQTPWGADCAPCDAVERGCLKDEDHCSADQIPTASWEDLQEEDPYTCGVSRKALRQERWYHFRCRLKALWRLIIIELLGYAALGGVLVAGMVMDVVPMGAAVPVFVACFMWVAVRFDRWMRG